MNISKNLTGVNNTRSDPFPRSGAITYVLLLIIESLVIITGNTIVLAAFTRTNKLKEKKCYWFCINLAVTDLLVGVIAGPYMMYEVSGRSGLVQYRGYLQIDLAFLFITDFLLYASLVNLTAISLERMYATLWPLKHRVLGARNYHVIIGLSWTLPLFTASINTAYLNNQISFRAVFSIWVAIHCFFSLIIVISYVSIWIKFKFFRHPQHHVTTAQDRKLTMSLFIVTAASMTTIVTGFVVTAVADFHFIHNVLSRNNLTHFRNSAVLLVFANSLLNPIIYAFKIPLLRQAVLRLLCRRTTKIQEPAIEMRNRAEVTNRQACAVVVHDPEPNIVANETQGQAIEMRNRAEVTNRQACPVVVHDPESNMAANDIQEPAIEIENRPEVF